MLGIVGQGADHVSVIAVADPFVGLVNGVIWVTEAGTTNDCSSEFVEIPIAGSEWMVGNGMASGVYSAMTTDDELGVPIPNQVSGSIFEGVGIHSCPVCSMTIGSGTGIIPCTQDVVSAVSALILGMVIMLVDHMSSMIWSDALVNVGSLSESVPEVVTANDVTDELNEIPMTGPGVAIGLGSSQVMGIYSAMTTDDDALGAASM